MFYACAINHRANIEPRRSVTRAVTAEHRPWWLKSSEATAKSQIPLRYPTSSRAGLRPASELDSVMEFGLSCTIHLASRSATSSRAGLRPDFRSFADRFELSRHAEIGRTWSQTASQLVCYQRASWSATC